MKLDFINDINLANVGSYFPELNELSGVIENNLCHNKESVLVHTMQVFLNCKDFIKKSPPESQNLLEEIVEENTKRDLFLLSVLFHDVGKKDVIVTDRGITSCPDHEAVGGDIFRELFKNKLSTKELDYCVHTIKIHTYIQSLLDNKQSFYTDYLNLVMENKVEISIFTLADIYNGDLKINNPDEYRSRVKLLSDILVLN